MHILHLLLSNNPVPAIFGGAVQQTVQELAEACVRKGHKVTVISRAHIEHKKELRKYNSQGVKYLYVYSKNTSRITLLRYLREYIEIAIENGPYDVVHTHVPYASPIFLLFKKKLGNPKFIWHVHNKGKFTSITKLLNIEIVGISHSIIKEIGGSLNNQRYSVIPNICREKYFPLYTDESKHNSRLMLNIPESKFVIAFVGRIVPEKGLHILLEAIKNLSEELQTKITLLVAGSSWFKNAEKNKYEQAIINQSINMDVRWLGYVDNWSLYKIYHACDVFIMPSVWSEPAGQVILEAQCCGTHVIASNVGGIPEYLSPFETTVEPNSPEKLANEIKKLLLRKEVNINSSEHDKTIAKKRSDWVKDNFSLDKITQMWLDLYSK